GGGCGGNRRCAAPGGAAGPEGPAPGNRGSAPGIPREPPGNLPGAAPACRGRPRELQFSQESSFGSKVVTAVSAADFLCHLEQEYLDSAKDLGILLNIGIFVSGLKPHQL
ncbi:hypothetical protein Nmel_015607, partial [Mimus melanotis]